jgi:hypothetical protein
VLALDVVLKPVPKPFKIITLDAANEALVFLPPPPPIPRHRMRDHRLALGHRAHANHLRVLNLVFLIPQLTKGVQDNTKPASIPLA